MSAIDFIIIDLNDFFQEQILTSVRHFNTFISSHLLSFYLKKKKINFSFLIAFYMTILISIKVIMVKYLILLQLYSR